MTDRTALDADETRARLLEAAVVAFAEKGFHGTTTRDIATAAGTSPAALYVHHESKEALLYLITRSGHESTLSLMQKAVESTGNPTDALRQVVYDFALDHANLNNRARVTNYELSALTPEHYTKIRAIRRQIEHEVRGLVEAGVASGEFDVPDARIATVALLSLGIDISRWYREAGDWEPEYIAQRHSETAQRIVGAGAKTSHETSMRPSSACPGQRRTPGSGMCPDEAVSDISTIEE